MARRSRTKPSQGTLEFKAAPGWGGARKGAGRKPRAGKKSVAHAKRARLKSYEPQHVTLRLVPELADLRRWRVFAVIVEAVIRAQRGAFRICAWTIQRGHLHLVTESNGWKALSDGLRAFEIRVARGLNKLFGRKGKAIADRYHARGLSSPTEVRNALVYVLQNARKHFQQRGIELRKDWIDRFSSAAFFDGWKQETRSGVDRIRGEISARLRGAAPPVAPPRTWLLATGWRRRGLLAPTEMPAAA